MAKRAAAETQKAIGKAVQSCSERVARESLEALGGRTFSDQEWDRLSKRLNEFVKLLSRWDAEQHASTKCAKMESKSDHERVA